HAGDTDRAAARERTRAGIAAGQIVEVERGNRLRNTAVEIDGATGDGVSVASRREHVGDADRAAISQYARATVAARQIVVAEGRNRLGNAAVEIDGAAGHRKHVGARR